MNEINPDNPFLKELLDSIDYCLYELSFSLSETSDIVNNISESKRKYVGHKMDEKNLEQKKLEYLLLLVHEITLQDYQNRSGVEANNEKLKIALSLYNLERFKEIVGDD
jgi:hypothetical protein